MRAYIKNNIKFLIAMIIVITLGIIGITYAIKIGEFTAIGLNANTSIISANITYDSTVNEGNITSTGNMLPISDTLVTGVDVTDTRVLKVKFMVTGVSNNPSNTIYDISLRDINMSSALKTEEIKILPFTLKMSLSCQTSLSIGKTRITIISVPIPKSR